MKEDFEALDARPLTDDLYSGDPIRVAAALQALDEGWKSRRVAFMPLLDAAILEAFGGSVPKEVLETFVRVVEDYPGFEPTPSSREIWETVVEALVAHGRSARALDLALSVRVAPFPDSAASDVMKYLERRELEGPDELRAARAIVEALLDSPKTREATVDRLRFWVMGGSHPELVEAVRPQLHDEERALLDAAAEE